VRRLLIIGVSCLALATPAIAAAPSGNVYTQAYRLHLLQHSCPEDAFKFVPGVNSEPDGPGPGNGFYINPDNRVRCVAMDGGRVTIAVRRGGIG